MAVETYWTLSDGRNHNRPPDVLSTFFLDFCAQEHMNCSACTLYWAQIPDDCTVPSNTIYMTMYNSIKSQTYKTYNGFEPNVKLPKWYTDCVNLNGNKRIYYIRNSFYFDVF